MRKRLVTLGALSAASLAMAACTSEGRDAGLDSHDLSTMAATIWVDPDGCKHWIIDDGIEGYMSPVLNVDGTPDCV